MFKKILIANRGEIACRIIRTARRMGIGTVAVHSEADRGALHVAMADEAVAIGPAPAAESYLSIPRLLEACRASGADAVHPGYGFLSERAAFARALAEAGIAFIGPNAAAIEAMGDKIESKRRAAAAGVSTVPGSEDAVADVAEAGRLAREIGYPVMIKASAGGGGKGLRIARDAGELEEGFVRARSEARASFGDDRVFVEKFIQNPRHIEIQVLGDRHGHVVHLGERECSIQRRNQKVVEEAPSPLLDPETRARMGAQAVALAQAVGYDSAGTVEFVAGQDRSFYFLEMNTRLQVEHPVTELVTGLDLVEQMIRIAAGEPLGLTQDAVTMSGWAVETRIYAEDPSRGFLPSTGRLSTYRPSAEGVHDGVTVRIDSGVVEGSSIPVHYDPMIAKLVTHAATREAAIAAQGAALDGFAIAGIRHNLSFLAAVMGHPRFRSGRLSTGFIAEEFPEGYVNPEPEGAQARGLAAVAAAVDAMIEGRRRRVSGRMQGAPPPGPRVVTIGTEPFAVEAKPVAGGFALRFDDGGTTLARSGWRPGDPVWRGTLDGEPLSVGVACRDGRILLSQGGAFADLRPMSPREAELSGLMRPRAAAGSGRDVLCPMPGVVREVLVAEGQEVRAGEPLVVIEAMKMENVLRATRDGRLARVAVRPGDTLAVDAVIVEFAP